MKRSQEVPTWKKITAGVTASLGMSGLFLTSGCSAESAPANPPAASASETPGGGEVSETQTASPNERWLPSEGDYLSTDKLAELGGDYDKIVAAFTIHEGDFSTFEQFAQLHNYISASYLRSGTSASEIAEAGNLPEGIQGYVTETYAEPFAEASSYEGAVDKNLDNNHRVIAVNTNATYTEEGMVKYTFDQELVEVVATNGKITDKTFSITYIAQRTDNFEDTVLPQYGFDSMKDKIKVTLTAHRMADGSIKTQTHWGLA